MKLTWPGVMATEPMQPLPSLCSQLVTSISATLVMGI